MDALIVASTAKQQYSITDVLHSINMDSVVCSTAAEARRVVLYRAFDIFVINGGLDDERGNELANYIADTFDISGVYIDDYTRADMFSEELGSNGVVTLVRPITKTALGDALKMIAVANTRVRELKARNDELSAKLEDIKYIARAKIALMRSLGFTEEQAHKYIEKKSMEMRLPMRKIAIDVLNMYEAD